MGFIDWIVFGYRIRYKVDRILYCKMLKFIWKISLVINSDEMF